MLTVMLTVSTCLRLCNSGKQVLTVSMTVINILTTIIGTVWFDIGLKRRNVGWTAQHMADLYFFTAQHMADLYFFSELQNTLGA